MKKKSFHRILIELNDLITYSPLLNKYPLSMQSTFSRKFHLFSNTQWYIVPLNHLPSASSLKIYSSAEFLWIPLCKNTFLDPSWTTCHDSRAQSKPVQVVARRDPGNSVTAIMRGFSRLLGAFHGAVGSIYGNSTGIRRLSDVKRSLNGVRDTRY